MTLGFNLLFNFFLLFLEDLWAIFGGFQNNNSNNFNNNKKTGKLSLRFLPPIPHFPAHEIARLFSSFLKNIFGKIGKKINDEYWYPHFFSKLKTNVSLSALCFCLAALSKCGMIKKTTTNNSKSQKNFFI